MSIHLLINEGVAVESNHNERVGQMLLRELGSARVSAKPVSVPHAAGAKSGGASSMAELVVTGVLSGTAVTAVASVVVGFVQRGAARSITLVSGSDRLELTAVSERTQKDLIERFLNHTAAVVPEEQR